jgi:hypothetical protein
LFGGCESPLLARSPPSALAAITALRPTSKDPHYLLKGYYKLYLIDQSKISKRLNSKILQAIQQNCRNITSIPLLYCVFCIHILSIPLAHRTALDIFVIIFIFVMKNLSLAVIFTSSTKLFADVDFSYVGDGKYLDSKDKFYNYVQRRVAMGTEISDDGLL